MRSTDAALDFAARVCRDEKREQQNLLTNGLHSRDC
jgi:hypothetical protein